MKLRVLTKEELTEIEYFNETGKRIDVKVTDSWVEESLSKATAEIRELQEAGANHWETALHFQEPALAARAVYRAWKRGEDITPLMEALGTTLKPA